MCLEQYSYTAIIKSMTSNMIPLVLMEIM